MLVNAARSSERILYSENRHGWLVSPCSPERQGTLRSDYRSSSSSTAGGTRQKTAGNMSPQDPFLIHKYSGWHLRKWNDMAAVHGAVLKTRAAQSSQHAPPGSPSHMSQALHRRPRISLRPTSRHHRCCRPRPLPGYLCSPARFAQHRPAIFCSDSPAPVRRLLPHPCCCFLSARRIRCRRRVLLGASVRGRQQPSLHRSRTGKLHGGGRAAR